MKYQPTKLTPAQVRWICKVARIDRNDRYRAGFKSATYGLHVRLARKFHVSRDTIRKILQGKIWMKVAKSLIGKPMAQRTHCPHGHEYSKENTILLKNPDKPGTFKRQCRECKREDARRRRREAPKTKK